MDIGLQLFSLEGCFNNDIKAKLECAAKSGFKSVELAGFGGLSSNEMQAELEKNNLTVVGSHNGMDIFKEKARETLEYVKAVGGKYMILPWATYETPEKVYEVAEVLNEVAEIAAEYGIKVGYHNHNQEFAVQDGKYILDLLMEKTNENVIFEVDVYWVAYADVDPYEYIASRGNRIEIIHMKQIDENKVNVVLPDGIIDFKKVMESAKYAKHYVVEQEEADVDMIEACRINGEFVQRL